MKQLNHLRTDNMHEIKTYSQYQSQFDNEYVKILKQGKRFFIEQYTGNDVDYFVLFAKDADEAIEIAKEHIYTTCDMVASESFDDDPTTVNMELAKWGFFDLEKNQADEDTDFVAIIEEKSFNGYTPLICHGVYLYKDALKKKNELDSENDGDVYYLQHNENARPVFYLIED